MSTLACLMHWYLSALYVAPVVAVGVWAWWKTRRTGDRSEGPPAASPTA